MGVNFEQNTDCTDGGIGPNASEKRTLSTKFGSFSRTELGPYHTVLLAICFTSCPFPKTSQNLTDVSACFVVVCLFVLLLFDTVLFFVLFRLQAI